MVPTAKRDFLHKCGLVRGAESCSRTPQLLACLLVGPFWVVRYLHDVRDRAGCPYGCSFASSRAASGKIVTCRMLLEVTTRLLVLWYVSRSDVGHPRVTLRVRTIRCRCCLAAWLQSSPAVDDEVVGGDCLVPSFSEFCGVNTRARTCEWELQSKPLGSMTCGSTARRGDYESHTRRVLHLAAIVLFLK